MTKSNERRRGTIRKASKSLQQAAIASTLHHIEQIEAKSPEAAGVIELLKSWLEDDSGYDEKTWPKLQMALNDERLRIRARKLFDE